MKWVDPHGYREVNFWWWSVDRDANKEYLCRAFTVGRLLTLSTYLPADRAGI